MRKQLRTHSYLLRSMVVKTCIYYACWIAII